MLALGLILGVAAPLPAGWRDLGTAVAPVDEGMSIRGFVSCVDQRGRYMVLVVHSKCIRVDLRNGERSQISIFGAGYGHASFQGLAWAGGGDLAQDGYFESGPADLFFYDGKRVGFTFPGSTMYLWPRVSAVARIGGPAFTESSALASVLRAGIDVMIPAGWPSDFPGHEDAMRHPRDLLLLDRAGSARVRLPSWVGECRGVLGGIKWRDHRLVTWAIPPSGPVPQLQAGRSRPRGWGAAAAARAPVWHLVEVRWSARSRRIRSLADWPTSLGRDFGGARVLADGSVCLPLVGGPVDPRSQWQFRTAILRPSEHHWRLYNGLIVYGTSYNGKFVVYRWANSKGMREARVGG